MDHTKSATGKLILMTILSFVAMYVLMYAMVDRVGNALPNLNQFYMAMLMTTAMVLIELAVMRSMYDKRVKTVATILSIIALIGSFAFIRNQTAVSDKAFLKSMIPHHASALLMCEKADLQDSDIKRLCEGILAGQQAEIDWMKAKLLTY